MQRVFVLSQEKKPLMPCLPARARKLLSQGKAKVYRRYPFCIILQHKNQGDTQAVSLKFDPGSKTTGVALVGLFPKGKGNCCLWGANLTHRGWAIKEALQARRAIRRSRRSRKTRYRAARWKNRRRSEGWLPPSLHSRIDNIAAWCKKLKQFAPVQQIEVESVRFDTQQMQNAEISGIEYQQGTLQGYEVREYLLEKFGHQCVYCGKSDVPLEIEHVIPRSQHGSDRISNLVISCRSCNEKKGTKRIEAFLKKKPALLKKIQSQLQTPLQDAAIVNSTRSELCKQLQQFQLPIQYSSGGQTKYNRTTQGYSKDHWLDAACVGTTGTHIHIPKTMHILTITAKGRGSRQKCLMNSYGFPRASAKEAKRVHGFQTGDLVKAVVPIGKKQGTYIGRVTIRSSGSFNIQTRHRQIQGISYRYCQCLQRNDGYQYT